MDEHVSTAGATGDVLWRLGQERRVLSAVTDSLSTVVIRLGVVYGRRSYTMNEMFTSALRHGWVTYHGDGTHRWPLVYVADLASLYLAIAEQNAGGIFHGVDRHPLPIQQVAALASLAAGSGGRTEQAASDVPEDSRTAQHTKRVSRDVPVTTTRSFMLGWTPRFGSFAEGAAVAYREWRDANAAPPTG